MPVDELSIPDALHGPWNELLVCDAVLADAINRDDVCALQDSAERRQQLITDFFEKLLPAGTALAGLRARLLSEALGRNESLLGQGQDRLRNISGASRQAGHNRRAIGAYESNDP